MKKPPMRMCAACREKREKRELLRFVRTAEGTILPDETGRVNGRGAYLCKQSACMRKAIKIRALDRALECPVDKTMLEQLAEKYEQPPA
ncbi:MAG: YlxR family protein [Clostridiales bacterium]|nr:YlxR family protein [Clostridiales bacterium]